MFKLREGGGICLKLGTAITTGGKFAFVDVGPGSLPFKESFPCVLSFKSDLYAFNFCSFRGTGLLEISCFLLAPQTEFPISLKLYP